MRERSLDNDPGAGSSFTGSEGRGREGPEVKRESRSSWLDKPSLLSNKLLKIEKGLGEKTNDCK